METDNPSKVYADNFGTVTNRNSTEFNVIIPRRLFVYYIIWRGLYYMRVEFVDFYENENLKEKLLN